MKYSCDRCDYNTDRKSSYDSHLRSKKHKDIVGNKQDLKNDVTELKSQMTELMKHIIEKEKNITDKEKLIDHIIAKDRLMETFVASKDKDVEFIKSMATKAGTIADKSLDVAKQSMSALTFLQTYYNNAPALEAPQRWLPEYKTLGRIEITESDDEEDIYDEEYYRVEKRRRLMNKIDTTNEDNFVKEINGKKTTLHEEIGQMIIASIKKDDPKIQSLWCSDVARLSYLMRDIVDRNQNIAEWKVDKRGTKMCDILIKPLLNEIIAITKEFMKRTFDKIAQGEGNDLCHLNMNEEITQLLDMLYSVTLTNQIKKYIAGALYLDKKDDIS